jgi:hypothetical protein
VLASAFLGGNDLTVRLSEQRGPHGIRKKPLGGRRDAFFFDSPKFFFGSEAGFTRRERPQREARHKALREERALRKYVFSGKNGAVEAD